MHRHTLKAAIFSSITASVLLVFCFFNEVAVVDDVAVVVDVGAAQGSNGSSLSSAFRFFYCEQKTVV
jgi:hypothetical protein